MKKRLIAALLLAAMLITMLPTYAFADSTQTEEETPIVSEEPVPEVSEEPAPEVTPEPSEEPAPEVSPAPSAEPAPETDPEPSEEPEPDPVEEPDPEEGEPEDDEEVETEVLYADTLDEYLVLYAEMREDYAYLSAQTAEACEANEYALCRLIVRETDTSLDLTGYGAERMIIRPNGKILMQFTDSETAKSVCDELNALPGIKYAEPDVIFETDDSESASTFSDSVSSSSAPYSWGVDTVGAEYLEDFLNDNGYTNNVYIAVIDSGFDTSNSYISGKLDTNHRRNVVDNTQNISPAKKADGSLNMHGSVVASVITDCTSKLSNVKIIPIRYIPDNGGGTIELMETAIEWAWEKGGADIINISQGIDNDSEHKTIDSAISDAIAAGCICVCSAGNGGEEVNIGGNAVCPAHNAGAITVSAVMKDSSGNLTRAENIKYSDGTIFTSAYGDAIDVTAPGAHIDWSGGTGWNGTSFSAPHISALCAMLCLMYPQDGVSDITNKLESCCIDLGDSGKDKYYGYGIPDMKTLLTGKFWIDGYWYYYNAGVKQYGWQTVNNKKCYFDLNDGHMLLNWQTIDGKKYYFRSDGEMQTGFLTLAGTKYYFNSDGTLYTGTGWKTIDKQKYYFNSDSTVYTKTGWVHIPASDKTTWYYFNSDNSAQTGWANIDSYRYYFNTGTAKMCTGLKTINNVTYYFRPSKDSAGNPTGSMVTGFYTVNGKKYLFGTNGGRYSKAGWLPLTILSKKYYYYFKADYTVKTGWLKDGSRWYYLDPANNGRMVTGWKKISGTYYYFRPSKDSNGNPSGSMVTGWKKLSNVWYYFNSSGAMFASKWLSSGGYWYYFKASGAMAQSETLTIGGKSYSFDASGHMIDYSAAKTALEAFRKTPANYKYSNYTATGYAYVTMTDYSSNGKPGLRLIIAYDVPPSYAHTCNSKAYRIFYYDTNKGKVVEDSSTILGNCADLMFDSATKSVVVAAAGNVSGSIFYYYFYSAQKSAVVQQDSYLENNMLFGTYSRWTKSSGKTVEITKAQYTSYMSKVKSISFTSF